MKSKSKVSKSKNQILMYILFIAIGIIIGIFSTITVQTLTSNKESKEVKEEQPSKKESPYTLEELYEIVENPEKYRELNSTRNSDYAYTMFHFYDYFNKSTPVKIAKEVEKDENGNVTKVLECRYLSYYEFMEYMKPAYDIEKEDIEQAKTDGRNEPYATNYRFYVDMLTNIN